MPVQRQRTVTAGRVARWLLLSCTLLGLALMHTIGHTGAHAGRPHQSAAAMAAPDGEGLVPSIVAGAAALLAPADCPAGHCDGHGSGGMSGWSVCVAILGGLLAVALLAALLASAISGRGHRRAESAGRPRVPRGPPHRPAGLALASVAVLRI